MSATKSAASDNPADAAGAGRETLPFGAFDPNLMGAAYSQTVLEMQREWLIGMGQLQRDYLTFIGERMRKDVEIAKRIAECRDMKAAVELQSAFAETAREDYMSEAQRMLATARELTEHCVERLAEVPRKGSGNGA